MEEQKVRRFNVPVSVMLTDCNRSYLFDGYMPAQESDVLRLQLYNSISQLCFLGFNTSLMLSGLFDLDSQIHELEKIFSNLFEHLHQEPAEGVLRLCAHVEAESFEIFADNQLRDLFANDKQDRSSATRVREGDSGFMVEGLHRQTINDATQAAAIMREALKQQTVLVSLPIPNMTIIPNSTEEKLYAPKIVGPAAHVFLMVRITQLVYVSSSKTMVQLDSTLQILSLAASENLSYHATQTEAISFMTLQQYEETYGMSSLRTTAKLRDLKQSHFGSQEIKKNLQLSSFKALSTLTRVVQILGSKFESSPSSSDLSKSQEKIPRLRIKQSSSADRDQSSPPPIKRFDSNHIPFRDSLLTRLLQTTLQGNCAQFFLTIVRSDGSTQDYSPSHSAMRFASSLYKLYNIISNRKKHLALQDFRGAWGQFENGPSYVSPLMSPDILQRIHQADSDAVDMLEKLVLLRFGDKKRFPLKNYSDFERAILDVRNDLSEISDFCEEMNLYLTLRQQRETAVEEEINKRHSSIQQVSSVESLLRRIRTEEERTNGNDSLLPRLRNASSPNLGRTNDSPPMLGKTERPGASALKGNKFSLAIQQLEPSASLDSSEAKLLGGKVSAPTHRTSLPDLHEYLLNNGVSDFNDKAYLPQINHKEKSSSRRRLLVNEKEKRNSASEDASEGNESGPVKAVRALRRLSRELDEKGLLLETEKTFFRAVSTGQLADMEAAINDGARINVKNSFGR